MYYNKRLKNNIYRCNQCNNYYDIRYLFPCEMVSKYIHDPCSIFNEKIVKIRMTPNPAMLELVF